MGKEQKVEAIQEMKKVRDRHRLNITKMNELGKEARKAAEEFDKMMKEVSDLENESNTENLEALRDGPRGISPEEIAQISEIVTRHNVTIQDLKIYAEFNDEVGAHGERLREYLARIREKAFIREEGSD